MHGAGSGRSGCATARRGVPLDALAHGSMSAVLASPVVTSGSPLGPLGESVVIRAGMRREAGRPRGGDRYAGLHGDQSGAGRSGRSGPPRPRRQRPGALLPDGRCARPAPCTCRLDGPMPDAFELPLTPGLPAGDGAPPVGPVDVHGSGVPDAEPRPGAALFDLHARRPARSRADRKCFMAPGNIAWVARLHDRRANRRAHLRASRVGARRCCASLRRAHVVTSTRSRPRHPGSVFRGVGVSDVVGACRAAPCGSRPDRLGRCPSRWSG